MPKRIVFLHNTENYYLYMVQIQFFLYNCTMTIFDSEALKDTEVPSELRI